jgi:hypothetical protein
MKCFKVDMTVSFLSFFLSSLFSYLLFPKNIAAGDMGRIRGGADVSD